MGRLVQAKPADARLFSTTVRDPGKEYLERVSRYIPGEIIAAYLAGIAAVSSAPDAGLRVVLYWVLFLGCLVLTPIYLRYMAVEQEPRRLHMLVGSVGFCVWAYSLGGLFRELSIYQAAIASILLIFFSLVSGLIAPTEGSK